MAIVIQNTAVSLCIERKYKCAYHSSWSSVPREMLCIRLKSVSA